MEDNEPAERERVETNCKGSATTPTRTFLIDKLQEFFPGYKNFKGPNNWQEKAIVAALREENVLICQPTGSGKSLAFQLPAFISDGFTLVISPLIALMKDQVKNFGKLIQFDEEAFEENNQTGERKQCS